MLVATSCRRGQGPATGGSHTGHRIEICQSLQSPEIEKDDILADRSHWASRGQTSGMTRLACVRFWICIVQRCLRILLNAC